MIINKSYDKPIETISRKACDKVLSIPCPKESEIHGTLLGVVATPIKTLNVFIQ